MFLAIFYIVTKDLTVLFLFVINVSTLIITFYIKYKKIPLTRILNSKKRTINLYHYGNIIDCHNYIIDVHTGFGGVLDGIKLIEKNQKKIIEFSTSKVIDGLGHEDNVIHNKIIIPLPEERYGDTKEIEKIINDTYYEILNGY